MAQQIVHFKFRYPFVRFIDVKVLSLSGRVSHRVKKEQPPHGNWVFNIIYTKQASHMSYITIRTNFALCTSSSIPALFNRLQATVHTPIAINSV